MVSNRNIVFQFGVDLSNPRNRRIHVMDMIPVGIYEVNQDGYYSTSLPVHVRSQL
jgi:hypothetical protein